MKIDGKSKIICLPREAKKIISTYNRQEKLQTSIGDYPVKQIKSYIKFDMTPKKCFSNIWIHAEGGTLLYDGLGLNWA